MYRLPVGVELQMAGRLFEAAAAASAMLLLCSVKSGNRRRCSKPVCVRILNLDFSWRKYNLSLFLCSTKYPNTITAEFDDLWTLIHLRIPLKQLLKGKFEGFPLIRYISENLTFPPK